MKKIKNPELHFLLLIARKYVESEEWALDNGLYPHKLTEYMQMSMREIKFVHALFHALDELTDETPTH